MEGSMLVLTRERDQVIRIGDDIKVTVVAIRGGSKVKLGVDAPATVKVHREEVYERIRQGEGMEQPEEKTA